MKSLKSNGFAFYFSCFFIIVFIACLPIWSFRYFVNQDGSAHLYSSFLMLELLKTNPFVSETYTLNSISVPNSSGHWLMVLLLNVFSPFTVTKIMQTLTFAGVVAATGWLRWQTAEKKEIATALLLGAVFAFNWLWFMGFYNFMIGVIFFIFTVGLYYRWREDLNLTRAAVLAVLILIVYFSHLISFAVLAASLIVLALFVQKTRLKSTLLWTFAAFLPAVPLIILYKLLSESGGGIYPQWRYLADPLSIKSWIIQLRGVDPFVIISRRRFPFSGSVSGAFAAFTPLLWLAVSLILLSLPLIKDFLKTFGFPKEKLPFLILFASFLFIALFSPDDFGYSHGSILRERIFICSLIFFVPLFESKNNQFLKRAAQICLIFIIIFQTFAVFDYARRTNADAGEFLAVSDQIPERSAIASVIVLEDVAHFHSVPLLNLNTMIGVNRNLRVWDNYEIGYYIFPVAAKNENDRRFVRLLSESNAFALNNPAENFDEKLAKLDSALESNHDKIDILIVWGDDARITSVLNKWFETLPFYQNGRARLFRHK